MSDDNIDKKSKSTDPRLANLSRAGRPKGTQNKTTAQIKEAITTFISNNSDKLDAWIEQVDDPAKRIDLYFKAMEYAVPKLARTEMVGDDTQPIKHVVKFED